MGLAHSSDLSKWTKLCSYPTEKAAHSVYVFRHELNPSRNQPWAVVKTHGTHTIGNKRVLVFRFAKSCKYMFALCVAE